MKAFLLILISGFTSLTLAQAKNYSASCSAGPIGATEAGYHCQQLSGVHVENGYDIAFKCAYDRARSDCLIDGNRNCAYLTAINHGWKQRPGSAYGDCQVQVYVQGD